MTGIERQRRELASITDRTNVIEGKKRFKLQAVLEKYFTAEEGDNLIIGHTYVKVCDGSNPLSYMDIYVDQDYEFAGPKEYTQLSLRYPGTGSSDVSQDILQRLERQAHYTRLALDFQDDILAEMNQIEGEYYIKVQEVWDEYKAS